MASLDDTPISFPEAKRVVVNAGGVLFHTTRGTLSVCGYFRAIFDERERNQEPIESEIFVDRDPDAFRKFLTLLRLGHEKYVRSLRTGDIQEDVLVEAEYFSYEIPLSSACEVKKKESSTRVKYDIKYRVDISNKGPPYIVGEMFVVDDEFRNPHLAQVIRVTSGHVWFRFPFWGEKFDTYTDFGHFRIRRPATQRDTDSTFHPPLEPRVDVPESLVDFLP